MTTGLKTLHEIEAEWQAKMAELTGLESKILEIHEKEYQIRNELQHLIIQKERLLGLPQEGNRS
jgi:hypothetical protein